MRIPAEWIELLIPLAGGILALIIPIRPNPPNLTEEKVKTIRTITRGAGVMLIGVTALRFLLMLAQGIH
jgi:hypothetical protein